MQTEEMRWKMRNGHLVAELFSGISAQFRKENQRELRRLLLMVCCVRIFFQETLAYGTLLVQGPGLHCFWLPTCRTLILQPQEHVPDRMPDNLLGRMSAGNNVRRCTPER